MTKLEIRINVQITNAQMFETNAIGLFVLSIRHSNLTTYGQLSASARDCECSAQKSSDMYFAAESQKIVTTTRGASAFRMRSAMAIAATMLPPEDTPTRKPSSRANFTTM